MTGSDFPALSSGSVWIVVTALVLTVVLGAVLAYGRQVGPERLADRRGRYVTGGTVVYRTRRDGCARVRASRRGGGHRG